jgi:hypothetical protein
VNHKHLEYLQVKYIDRNGVDNNKKNCLPGKYLPPIEIGSFEFSLDGKMGFV